MTSFSRFQERNKKRTVAQNKLNTSFIFKGYPSIEIQGSADQKIQASVVNKQEKDYAYVFTQTQDELEIGSVWAAKNLHLLITEEITIIKDVNWHKYHALLCNVQIDNHWGYFKGPEKSFLDVVLEKERYVRTSVTVYENETDSKKKNLKWVEELKNRIFTNFLFGLFGG